MIVRNTLCKRVFVTYCTFFLTALLIWKYYEESMNNEEEENNLQRIVLPSIVHTISNTHTNEKQANVITPIELNRLDYWLKNNSKTIGINLTAILAPKRPRKYLVYVCHETCGGNQVKRHLKTFFRFFLIQVGEIDFEVL